MQAQLVESWQKRNGCISTSVVRKLSSPPKSTLGFTAASLIDKYWTNHNHQTVMRLGERNCLLCWLKQKLMFQIYRLYRDINSYLNLPLERLNMINDLIQHQCCSWYLTGPKEQTTTLIKVSLPPVVPMNIMWLKRTQNHMANIPKFALTFGKLKPFQMTFE